MGSHEDEECVALLSQLRMSPSWTGDCITHMALYRQAPLYFRVDALPFVFQYSALFAAAFAGMLSKFTFWAFLAAIVTLHILAFLVQHWSLRAKALMSLSRVRFMSKDMFTTGPVLVLAIPKLHRGKAELVPLEESPTGVLFFNFQKRTYVYSNRTNTFEMIEYPTELAITEYISAAGSSSKTSTADAEDRRFKFGRNVLEMPTPTFSELYVQHLLAPFFVFQVFCIFLWLLDEYWQYSVMTLFMMLLFEATVVHGRIRSLRELRGMRNKPRSLFVFRDKKWTKINSLDLLPGDIISIDRSKDEGDVVPCDVLLLGGSVVVNEAMLTGESVPLMKEALSPQTEDEFAETLSIKDKHKMSVLFGGTRVLTVGEGGISQAVPKSKPPDGGCVCYVLRTGFGSSQGELMTTILYSTETVSANSWEAALFILFLLVFAIAASGYVLYNRYSVDSEVRYKLLLRCVLIITSVVPPELPMQLALAVNTSLIALHQCHVFCTEPFRIPYAGKIDVCCFDKTGTLTTDTINAAGVALPSSQADATSQGDTEGDFDQKEEVDFTPAEYAFVPVTQASLDASMVLASCHSLVYIDSGLIGDPLELAALEAVEWNYGRSGTCVPKRGGASATSCRIVRRFRFASELQRMSVVAQITGNKQNTGPRILMKGSPEAVGKLLKGGVLPEGYEYSAKCLARRGLRVLALAVKDLDDGLTASQLSKITRADAESEMTFVGFVCFECPLREDSRKVVRRLKKAGHHTAMITGDATLTAAHVATQVGMATKSVLILEKSVVDIGSLEWVSASSGKRKKRFIPERIPDLRAQFDLCVAGPALDEAIRQFPSVTKMFQHIMIYARMSPDQKEMVLTGLKEVGLNTLMCGDGTNDVGALKQAHVGVALLSTTNISKDEAVVPAPPNAAGQSPETKNNTRNATPSKGQAKLRQRKGKGSSSKAAISKAGGNDGSASGSSERPRTQREIQAELYAKKLEELQSSLDTADPDQAPLVKLGDASIASPFTSRRMTIDSCISIIRQGRCTLATTLQMYQILALNCLINAFSLSVLHLEGVAFGDKQMTITGVIMAIAFFLISRSKPLKRLSPERPSASVFSPELFVSLLAQFAIHVGALVVAMQFAKEFVPADFKPTIEEKFEPSVMNTVIFLLSISQQVNVMVVNYKGRPFMEGLSENKGLRSALLAVTAIVLVCTAEISSTLNDYMELASWPSFELQSKVVGVIAVDFVACFVLDFIIRKCLSRRVREIE